MIDESSQPLLWACDQCGRPVVYDTGYLCVRRDDDGQGAWRVYHEACDPQPGQSEHRIDIEHVGTRRDLSLRTSILLSYRWFMGPVAKSWIELCTRICADSGVNYRV